MGRTSKNTRDRIVAAAVELFSAQGYEATGMAQILQQAKANSGSFYFFFKSKEELLHAVLDWHLENLEAILLRPVYEQTGDPIERVFVLLENYRQKILMTNFSFVCPIGRLALEIDPAKREVHDKIANNFRAWTAAVRACLEEADGRLPQETNLDELSQMVLTVMEGGAMQARAQREIEPYDSSVQQLRNYFRQLEETARGTRQGSEKHKRKST